MKTAGWPRIKALSIIGLKGASGDYEFGRRTVVAGPNGAGKSRIGEALAFLLGRPVAGLDIGANNLRELLAGGEIRVVATVESPRGDIVITRIRQMTGATFKRPTLLVDGVAVREDALIDIFGGEVDAPGGADLIGMSEAKLVAAIAGFAATAEAVDEIEAEVVEVGVTFEQGGDGAATARLDALARAATAAVSAAARERRSVEAGADLSRQELGDRFDINEAAAARRRREEATTQHGDARQEAGAAHAQIAALDGEIATLRSSMTALDREIAAAAMAGPDRPTQADFDDAHERLAGFEMQHALAKEARSSARKHHKTTSDALSAAWATLTTAIRERDRVAERIDGLTERAKALDSAPCARCPQWQPEDPFEEAVDLAGACPLLASARSASAKLVGLAAELRTRTEAVSAADADVKAAEAADDLAHHAVEYAIATEAASDDRMSQAEAHIREMRDFVAKMDSAESLESMRARRAEADLTLASMEARRDEMMEAAGAKRAAVTEAYNALAAATTEAEAAAGRAERFRRLQADRERLARAEAAEAKLKAVAAEVEAVQRAFLTEGLAMLRQASARYLPGLALDVVGGRLGVRDVATDAFWSGGGLSAAQRAMLELALDRAVETLSGRAFPLVVVEADTIDDANLAELISALDHDIETGAVAQAVIIAWRRVEAPGWVEISVSGGPRAAAVNPEPDVDPWADPWEEDRPTIPDLLAGLDGIQMTRLWQDAALPELRQAAMPRRIVERKNEAIRVFAGLGYDVASAAIERARKAQ